MKSSNCYMPTWTADGKLVKRGSYCNWEAVLSHANALPNFKEDIEAIKKYIYLQIGGMCYLESISYKDLEHMGGRMSAKDYHDACCYMTNEVCAVKINEAGHSSEVIIDTNNGKLDFNLKLPPKLASNTQLSQFRPHRKGKQSKDLCVFFYDGHNNGCELNSLVSNLFKMQIYGEVMLVQCSKEQSFIPRERFLDFTLSDFESSFLRKRKRITVTPLAVDDYEKVKAEMQVSLSTYEQEASSLAELPCNLTKVARMQPPDGRQLAKMKKHELLHPEEV